VERLKGTPSRLMWASTTPVVYSRHRASKPFDRREGDVVRYNRAAARVMRRHGLAINDLHGAVEGVGRRRCVGGDGVHMTDLGNRVLSRAVSECLRDLA
jgi:lysophospholipase L1-like esterase